MSKRLGSSIINIQVQHLLQCRPVRHNPIQHPYVLLSETKDVGGKQAKALESCLVGGKGRFLAVRTIFVICWRD